VRKPFFPVVLFFLTFAALFGWQPALADCRSFSSLIRNGGYAVGGQDGQIALSCNENTPFIPASIIKIPLALAAFDILGPDFRFTTEFSIDRQNNLYVKGYGDPFLVSEEVDLILNRLIEKGVQIINSIYIDNSSADLATAAPGRGESNNPYDVPISPVAVNFNTVNIRVDDGGRIESAEAQTPTLPIMHDLGKGFPPGEYRINICRDNCPADVQSARYTAELFRDLQRRKGIGGRGSNGIRKVPRDATLVYAHQNTRNLEEVVYFFLKYSNNFIANQVYLRCGAEVYGAPVTWKKAGRAVHNSLSRLLGPQTAEQIHLEEGSGLSRKNRITAKAMLEALKKFKPHNDLLQEKKNSRIKSGTLEGVYNYAGYLNDDRPFVILLNQKENTRDRVLERLENQK